MDSGVIMIHARPTQLGVLAREAVERFTPQAHLKGIEVTHAIPRGSRTS